jgi:LysM repeat protein
MIKFRIYIILAIIFFICIPAISQVAVERSKVKVIISGETYYLHTVKKGETIYSISKAYGITTDELIRENPSSINGLKEAQTIRIKASIVSSVQPSVQSNVPERIHDDSRFIYHRLQPGETVYYLSKTYSVSENEIIRSNPGIDISKLPAGFEIAVPRKDLMTRKQSFADQDDQGYYHKVVRGETLSSIARKYGVTIRDLRRENGDTRFPQVGDFLKIPGLNQPFEQEVLEADQDTVLFEKEEQVVYLERPDEFTTFRNLTGSFDVAVILPFYLLENAKRTEIDSSAIVNGKRTYRVINRSDDWIYPRSLGFLEMYEGILLAADTLSSLGLNINIHAFDITGDSTQIIKLIRSGNLDNMDLIIGPVHSSNLIMVASYAGGLGIPVVSPVQLSSNTVLRDSPLLYMASSSLEVAQKAIARKMREYSDNNIVLLHSDSVEEIDEINALRNFILGELSRSMPFEEIRMKDMVFYSRSVIGNDSISRLAYALSEKTGNAIIVASENPPVMSESIIDIHTLSRKYSINVFGYPNMRYLDNFNHRIWFELGLMIYSPYWIDYSQKDVKKFNYDFRLKYLTEPSEMSYAWQGYDILYYFLSGLALYGREFLSHPEIHNPDLLHTQFDFHRNSIYDGFENIKLFLIRYSNNYEVELLEETPFYNVDYSMLE